MKQISNARKAREIVENAHSSSFFSIEDCETFDVKLLGKTVKRRDVDSLKPEIRRAIKYGAITMGVWKDEAQIFSSKEIDRVMYKYGLEEDYTAIEIDEWVPGGFEIADSKDEEKMLAGYERK